MAKWKGAPWLLRHLVVAIGYGLAYAALVSVSKSYWWPSAGLRLACLLIFPYRYWPALLIGEFMPLVYQSAQCADQFGLAWAVAHSFPVIALAMPVIKWFRDQRQIDRAPFAASMSALLEVTTIVSFAVAAINVATFTLTLTHLPAGYTAPSLLELGGWRFLGNFLGTLTVVPVVLAILEVISSNKWPLGIRHILPRQAVWESLIIVSIFIALVVAGRETHDATMRYAVDAAFFCPVTWIAFRRGWQGAACGSVVASIGIMLTPHDIYDPGTILALGILASWHSHFR